jgi:gas vesicle protein
MSDQITFVCNDLTEEESQAVTKVMAQTNYDEQTAKNKLSQFGFSITRVLRDYMGIPDVKQSPKIKSVNQEIYKQIRYTLDNSMREYREKNPIKVDQVINNFQESDEREKEKKGNKLA